MESDKQPIPNSGFVFWYYATVSKYCDWLYIDLYVQSGQQAYTLKYIATS